MFRFFKKICHHYWYKVAEEERDIGSPDLDIDYQTFIHIYCPKCDSTKLTTKIGWEIVNNSQKVKAEFYRD